MKKTNEIEHLIKNTGLTKEQIYKVLLKETKFVPKVIDKYFKCQSLKVGIIADTHIGSWYECLDELHTFYKICEKQKVKAILHAGDILDGAMTHKGWENEIHTFGADKQVAYCIKHYPSITGVKTYFILGNHDLSHWKKNGTDVGKLISKERDDLIYIGQSEADLILNDIKFKLFHPSGCVAYALSYRGQKIAEQIASGTKPNILIIGHFHTSFQFVYRNMYVFNAGCFQNQTPYLREKALNPAVGGWILEIFKIKDEVLELNASWIPFYRRM